MKKIKESDLQREILDYLRLVMKAEAIKFPSVGIYKKATGTYITQSKKGVSDILACLPPNGRFMAVECKVKGRQATPEQLEFLAEVKKRGGIAILAHSFEEFEKELEKYKSNSIWKKNTG